MAAMRLAEATPGTPAELRARADQARARLARLTLAFPVAGSIIILGGATLSRILDGPGAAPDTGTIASALVQLWGLYGPYLVAITAYLWAQSRVQTASEKAPNGWQMGVLAHSFTMHLIILIYTVPLLIYLAGAQTLQGANDVMSVYQSAVHTFTAAAITYFFARPEGDAPAAKKA